MAAAGFKRIGRGLRFVAPPGVVADVPHVMPMVRDGFDVIIDIRIKMLPGLPLVSRAGNDVIQMRNHAGCDKRLAAVVEIDAPGIAGPPGENFKLMPDRMIPPDPGIEGFALFIGRAGLSDFGVRKHAMTAIQPTVRPPDERVQSLMRVVPAEAVQQHVSPRRDILRKLHGRGSLPVFGR